MKKQPKCKVERSKNSNGSWQQPEAVNIIASDFAVGYYFHFRF